MFFDHCLCEYLCLCQVVYVTHQREGDRIIRNEVNLIAQLAKGDIFGQVEIQTLPYPFNGGGVSTEPRPTRPTSPPTLPQTTAITFVEQGVGMSVPHFNLKDGYSITFKFQTINQVYFLFFH